MSTANDRLVKWRERYSGDSKPACISEDYKTHIVGKLSMIFTKQVAVEKAVSAILGEAGVNTIMNGAYHGFAKQVASLKERFQGGQLLNACDIVLNSWAGRGLDRDILERIRNSVFALGAPPPEN